MTTNRTDICPECYCKLSSTDYNDHYTGPDGYTYCSFLCAFGPDGENAPAPTPEDYLTLTPESNTEAAQQHAAELEQAAPCQHPPHRLYCGYANNEQAQMSLWVACCDCGAVLKA